jgi:hypothetical protein
MYKNAPDCNHPQIDMCPGVILMCARRKCSVNVERKMGEKFLKKYLKIGVDIWGIPCYDKAIQEVIA